MVPLSLGDIRATRLGISLKSLAPLGQWLKAPENRAASEDQRAVTWGGLRHGDRTVLIEQFWRFYEQD